MNLTHLWHSWRYQPRHRAADLIPLLEADLQTARHLAEHHLTQLDHADALIGRMCQKHTAAHAELDQLRADLATLREAHELLLDEHAALAARLRETRTDLANIRAISSPAPADHAPAITTRPYDPDATTELNVRTLWDGKGLVRVTDVHHLITLNTTRSTAA